MNRKPIYFSFKYLDKNDSKFKFSKDTQKAAYIKLFERLKEMSSIDDYTFRYECRDNTYRCHPIPWDKTCKENGFGLDSQLETDDCWQFNSGFQQGRVHGFFIKNVFYIVWIDFSHNLQNRKNT